MPRHSQGVTLSHAVFLFGNGPAIRRLRDAAKLCPSGRPAPRPPGKGEKIRSRSALSNGFSTRFCGIKTPFSARAADTILFHLMSPKSRRNVPKRAKGCGAARGSWPVWPSNAPGIDGGALSARRPELLIGPHFRTLRGNAPTPHSNVGKD